MTRNASYWVKRSNVSRMAIRTDKIQAISALAVRVERIASSIVRKLPHPHIRQRHVWTAMLSMTITADKWPVIHQLAMQ